MNDMTNKEKRENVLGIHDDEGMENFRAWNESQAEETAKELGISLTDDHWKVIKFMRVHYENNGQLQHARELTEALNERFEDEGGSRWLYRLFPNGPVNQGTRIAGVPAPGDVADPHFGSVQ
ncbi:TusE/DsrC/DsvC family sulfur relay protein [Thiohalophilus sp.]|uniref:TusE/DsrC/DsvC family sulfur relay protein n=1 Tax=Thiohalophilus sp. TaxID=3028392 RepID=UPI002ACE7276|nr:TusE/DsrC/DsvC family sulfur relay protein [Thiohalophilus sp.]MDZ7660972.1 TusE/DsrC/DsvC family sulfur relay protein [Thiohalophilus sp.]